MTSSKLILIFLAFIFFLIVVLSSSKIANFLRSRFGSMVPSISPISEDITPTPSIIETTLTPTPTIVYGNGYRTETKGGIVRTIPASGPEDLAWLILGGSFSAGIVLKKISSSAKS